MFTERSINNAVKLDLLCNFAAVYNLYVISHFFLLLPISHAKTMMYRMKTWLKNKPKGSSINDYFFFLFLPLPQSLHITTVFPRIVFAETILF